MWSSTSNTVEHSQTIKITITDDGKVLSHSDVIKLWLNSERFRLYFTDLLCVSDFDAFFWEMPAITVDTCNRPFECILNNAQTLVNVQADALAFSIYFGEDDVVGFNNLGNDAILIVPSPLPDVSVDIYAHLASFMRSAPVQQKHLLLQKLAERVHAALSDRPLWVSTSGLGIYWLHVRLDSSPKYYTFAPYRQADFYTC